MSRIAKNPVKLPQGVEVAIDGQAVQVTGTRGSLGMQLHPSVTMNRQDDALVFDSKAQADPGMAMAGTMRALIDNMVTGVSHGFERRLQLVGVGYRAQLQGRQLNLTLGFSHPVAFAVPEGIEIEVPSQAEIVIRGIDKQLVGHVAAKIRSLRPPEPYKGKGVKYANEQIVRKEAKKK